MIIATCATMFFSSILLCIQGCGRGDYECSLKQFPYVSTTLGVYPNDKIYVFIMNIFSALNFASYRAYYKKLNGLCSPLLNCFLLISGYVTLISGPVLALFDSVQDSHEEMDIHCKATAIFVIAQVCYLFPLTTVLAANQD